MAESHLKISLEKLLNDLRAQGASDEEIHRRWREEYAKRRKELDDEEFERRRLKDEKEAREKAYWDGWLDGRKELMEEMGWKYPDYKKPEPPKQEPWCLEDIEDDRENEMPEGSWNELWQEIYRCHKEEEEEEMKELPSTFGELFWKMHWY